jgi:hypothetical protein
MAIPVQAAGRRIDRHDIPKGMRLSEIAAGHFIRSGWLPELQVRRRGGIDEDGTT